MKKLLFPLGLFILAVSFLKAAQDKPHAVLVVGTLHYSPELTMPVFAKELERFGFRTTVVMGEGNPEKKTENVLPGIEVLEEADLAEALDPEMADRARTALIELVRAVEDLAEKAQDMQPEAAVLTGTHHAGYYEWLMQTEARK